MEILDTGWTVVNDEEYQIISEVGHLYVGDGSTLSFLPLYLLMFMTDNS